MFIAKNSIITINDTKYICQVNTLLDLEELDIRVVSQGDVFTVTFVDGEKIELVLVQIDSGQGKLFENNFSIPMRLNRYSDEIYLLGKHTVFEVITIISNLQCFKDGEKVVESVCLKP